MKVLYIIDSLTSGGKERQLVELLKGITKKDDICVRLIILSDIINYNYINDLNIVIDIIKRKSKKDLSVFNKIYNVCHDFKPDIIHSWELMCSFYTIPIAKIIGAKFLNGIIRYSPANFNIFKHKKFITTNLSFLFSDIILSNSNAGLKSYRAPKHKSHVIHNGFDLNRLFNTDDKTFIKDKYNIKADNIVGMVARFHERKDYFMFIMSAINILQNRNNVTFVTVGDGNTLDDCKNLVPSEYKDNILFLGNLKDVESIINIFDIGVLVSYEEGISNSIMEYMAFEKPVIATLHGGNDELVLNNTTGFLVKPNNIRDLSDKIEFLLNNRDIAKAMGKSGKERLMKDFSIEVMTDEHIKLYNKLLRQL